MKKLSFVIATIFFFNVTLLFAVANNSVKTAEPKGKSVKVEEKTDDAGYLSNALNNVKNPSPVSAPSVLRMTINMVLALLFVIGMIYLVMLGVKFFYVKSSIPLKNEGVVKILAKEYIDNKKSLYVIEFADRIILVGSGGETINVLSEIKDKETVAKVRDRADEYLSKYKIKKESRFAEELKSSYLKQGKKMVNTGNITVKKVLDKLKKSDDK